MILRNAVIEGKLQDLAFEKGKIVDINNITDKTETDVKGKRVIPGLVEIHAHGCVGNRAIDCNFDEMCDFLARNGTTSWYPTSASDPMEVIANMCESDISNVKGANILGFHMEGPFLNTKRKGGMNPEQIRKADIEEFRKYKNVKLITVAPEVEGNMDFIRLVSKECVVAIGHTDCDLETAEAAIDAGAKCLNHTFNAMTPLHHRDPGPIGAAINKNIYAQFICDGFHISKPIITMAYRTFGPEKMVLISDSVQYAHMPDGVYQDGDVTNYVVDGKVRMEDGTINGSTATLFECVKQAVRWGIPFDDAVRMASRTPCELMGEKSKGQLKVGFDADILVLDDNMEIETVIIGGEIYCSK